jgi:leader peptidase (prepilin peptidase)/N-methyltransferase
MQASSPAVDLVDSAANPAGDAPAADMRDAGAAATPAAQIPIPRHPLLGVAVVALTVLSFALFGLEPKAFITAFIACVLAVLAAIDIQHRLLPNRILLPATAVVLVAQVAFYPEHAVAWLLAGPAAAAFLALPLLVRRDAMGMGDIKLALLLGAAVGWGVFGAIVIGCVAMVPVAVLMLGRDGSIRGATLPFGPFLAFGTIVVKFASAS